MKIPLAVLALAAAGVAACSSVADPGEFHGPSDARRVVGVVRVHGDSARVGLPAEARVGEEVRVTVVTYGGGCVRQGETVVEVAGLQALVIPYDLDARISPDVVCTADLRPLEHTATLLFQRPGEARVRVKGRELPSGRTVTLFRSIAVR